MDYIFDLGPSFSKKLIQSQNFSDFSDFAQNRHFLDSKTSKKIFWGPKSKM